MVQVILLAVYQEPKQKDFTEEGQDVASCIAKPLGWSFVWLLGARPHSHCPARTRKVGFCFLGTEMWPHFTVYL